MLNVLSATAKRKRAKRSASQQLPPSLDPGTPHFNSIIRFRGTDGMAVDRTVIGAGYGSGPVATHSLPENDYGVVATDLSIGILNEDLPATVRPVRLYPYGYGESDLFHSIIISQMWAPHKNALLPYPGPQSWYDIGFYHQRRNQSLGWAAFSWQLGKGTMYKDKRYTAKWWEYGVWSGDSGSPNFSLVRDELLLKGLISSSDVFRPPNLFTNESLPRGPLISKEDYLNRMIYCAEQRAIAAGTLEDYTGYKVQVAHDLFTRND